MPFRFEERYVRGSDGTRLFYERFGKGHAMALCDGVGCDGFIWSYLITALVSEFDLVHWHYPGHGHSDEPPNGTSLAPERLADDLALVLRDGGISKATIVAHSLGVQVALETWRRHPDLVDALVLICGAPGRLIKSMDSRSVISYFLPAINIAQTLFPRTTSFVFRKLPTHALARLTLFSQEINIRLIRRPDLDAYFSGMRRADFRTAVNMARAADGHDATAYLHEIDVPVLLLGGALDRMTPSVHLEEMARHIANAELLISKSGSHALPVEQPDLVNLKIKQFLSERIQEGTTS